MNRLLINQDFIKVDPCYEFRYKQSNDESNESSDQYVKRLLEQLENKILQIGPENVAAFSLKL